MTIQMSMLKRAKRLHGLKSAGEDPEGSYIAVPPVYD
jgi:hypothetical protein